VRGPQASVGLYRDPVRTGATYRRDGWIRTGDIVVRDRNSGHITVVGRKKEIIIRGGVNIAPRELEELIAAFPEVDRVSVVGVPDDRLGERTCACIVFHKESPPFDLAELTARLGRQGVAVYKFPELIYPMATLPMTASGKVQKHKILEEIARAQKMLSGVENRESI
jgi:acyl-CoA synthetase